MSEDVTPALTPEQWAAQMAIEPDMPRPASVAHFGGVLVVRVPGQGACNVPDVLVPALAAFANAVRDDSDPGKLTWAMVDAIAWAAIGVRSEAYQYEQRGDDTMARNRDAIAADMEAAAEAIAALLPPR